MNVIGNVLRKMPRIQNPENKLSISSGKQGEERDNTRGSNRAATKFEALAPPLAFHSRMTTLDFPQNRELTHRLRIHMMMEKTRE